MRWRLARFQANVWRAGWKRPSVTFRATAPVFVQKRAITVIVQYIDR